MTVKTFDVYHHPFLGYDAVKSGLSWPAFFFGALWALSKKMWGIAAGIVLMHLALGLLEELIGAALYGGYPLLWLLIGASGNEWRRNKLRKQGFEQVARVRAATPEAAIASAAQDNEDAN